MLDNDDYTTGNLLDYLDYEKYDKLTGIDLSWQTNTSIPQKIDFVEKLDEDDGAKMLFIVKKQEKTILNFSLISLIVPE